MEQRRKIIIPTGADPDVKIPAPHFDTEATLSAQPVVPLANPAAPSKYNPYALPGGADSARRATASQWKRSTLILIVLVAVGFGVAGGLAIGLYQSQKKATPSVVTEPAVNETQQAATQPDLPPQPRVKQPEQKAEAQAPIAPPVEAQKDSADETRKENQENDNKVARDNPKRTEERVPPPIVSDQPADDPTADERDQRRERRERRREERRRQREENQDNPLDVPRNIERAKQEINRIRDIFEGRQP